MKSFNYLIVITILHLLSCSNTKYKQDEWDQQNTRIIDSTDFEMANAFKKAQDSLGHFLNHYNLYSNDTSYHFFVKSKFIENNQIEHMWAIPLEIIGKNLTCKVDNQPQIMKQIQLGDTVLINLSNIEDFEVSYKGVVILGGYLHKTNK